MGSDNCQVYKKFKAQIVSQKWEHAAKMLEALLGFHSLVKVNQAIFSLVFKVFNLFFTV